MTETIQKRSVISVVIVEDYKLTRVGLKSALNEYEHINVVAEAEDAEEGLKAIEKFHPDVVLMDLGLPGMNGLEATMKMKEKFPKTKVIILTSHSSEEEVINSIKSGARAYCSKDINPEMLSDIVLSVIEGALWFDSKVADIVIEALSDDRKLLNTDFMEGYNLTDREKDVIEYICEGLTNSEISGILDVSINTVKVHVSSIIQKLGVEDRTQVVVKAFKHFKK